MSVVGKLLACRQRSFCFWLCLQYHTHRPTTSTKQRSGIQQSDNKARMQRRFTRKTRVNVPPDEPKDGMMSNTTTTPAGLAFDLSADLKMLQELACDFTLKEITPKAEHYDRTGEWPWKIFHKAREVGLVNLNIPEEYGGMGASVLEECIVGEEMAYGCTGIETAHAKPTGSLADVDCRQ